MMNSDYLALSNALAEWRTRRRASAGCRMVIAVALRPCFQTSPPLAAMFWPVIHPLSGPARNAATSAISDG